jgi:tetratricopeptide (TPR) repeat protein
LKKTFAIAVALLCTAALLFGAEDWRGNNRISGVVVDKATGKAVPNAKVSLRIQKGSKGGPDTKTDNNGKWVYLGLLSGAWDLDISAAGYEQRQQSFQVLEGKGQPPIKSELTPAVTAPAADASAPAEIPKEEVKIGGQSVSKDIADAVDAGNAALSAQNYKDAIASYEKASAALPAFMPIKFALARAYWGDKQVKKAIAAMDEVVKADPANAQNAALLASMLLEDGQTDRAKEIIEKLPEDAISTDMLLNSGITLMNKKQPGGAIAYFTKAIAKDPKSHLGYYYRGLAYLQENKSKDAKPDLQKVLELAPESAEAKDAKEYLKSIK